MPKWSDMDTANWTPACKVEGTSVLSLPYREIEVLLTLKLGVKYGTPIEDVLQIPCELGTAIAEAKPKTCSDALRFAVKYIEERRSK